MPENEILTPGSLTPQDTGRILASIGEDAKPRNEAGQFVSENPAPEKVEPATESVPEGADAAPDESQPSGENEEQDSTEAPPAAEPPASWAVEDHEIFKSLPPAAQMKIAERERQRDLEVRRGQDEVAKEKTDTQRLREEYQTKLNQVVPALAKQLQGKWANVNWTQLANDHPADYVKYKAEFDNDMAMYQAAESEKARLTEKSTNEFVQEQEKLLPSLIPAWKDEKVARAELSDVVRYLEKEGIPKDVLYHPDGRLKLINARQITLARKAMLYDRAQARVAKPSTGTSKPAPQVQKPGSSDPGRSETQATAKQWDRLQRSGDPRDAAALISKML